jgi:uncharacterized protein (TIGR02246 family)
MSRQRRSLPAWIIGLSLLLGSTAATLPAQGARAGDFAARTAIDAANRRWQAAVLGGSAAGFAAEFSEDATFAVPMATVATGRAAIGRSTRDWLAAVKVDSIGLTRTDLRILGDVAIEIGTVRTASTPRSGTTSTVDHANYLTVWHRQRDGGWKIVRDMTSPLPRPAATAR